jgi:quercetin dioxygenase-like cupin family protein
MALRHFDPGEKARLTAPGDLAEETRSRALVKTDRFEAVNLVLRAGSNIASHSVDGPITLQCIEGRVVLETSRGEIELEAGDWVYLEGGDEHGLRAAEDSSLLLTILF